MEKIILIAAIVALVFLFPPSWRVDGQRVRKLSCKVEQTLAPDQRESRVGNLGADLGGGEGGDAE
jgi:hypothetical protein